MKDSTVVELARKEAAASAKIVSALAEVARDAAGKSSTVLSRMADDDSVLRSARYDGRSSARPPRERDPKDTEDDGTEYGIGDPVGSAATAGVSVGLGPAARRELEQALRERLKITNRIVGLLELWPAPHLAGEADLLALARANIRPEPGCDSCRRVEQAKGVPYWSPIHGATILLDDGTEVALCRTCREWCRATGAMPPPRFVENLRDGREAENRRLRATAAQSMVLDTTNHIGVTSAGTDAEVREVAPSGATGA